MALHAMRRKISAHPSSTLKNEVQKGEHTIDSHSPKALSYCYCSPLSTLHATHPRDEQIVPATAELNSILRSRLQTLFPHSTSLSVILVHVTQVEHLTLVPHIGSRQQRHLHHGPPGFIDQMLVNLRRVIRNSDQLLLHEGTGFALVLPDVDQQGTYLMLERIYN